MLSRERSSLLGIGQVVTTAVCDASFVMLVVGSAFTAPIDAYGALVAPSQETKLISKGAMEDSGLYEDSKNNCLYKDNLLSGDTEIVPLFKATEGRHRNLYPVQVVWVDVDGKPFDWDVSDLAQKYRAYLRRNDAAGAFPDVVTSDTLRVRDMQGANVTIATPPCADYSTAGLRRGDTTLRGQLVHSRDALPIAEVIAHRRVSPIVEVLQIAGVLPIVAYCPS